MSLGRALLSTEHVVRMVKELQDCIDLFWFCLLPLGPINTATSYDGILRYCRYRNKNS